jgi:muconolactone delta-isomerase
MKFDPANREALTALVPAERAHVVDLHREGKLHQLFVAADGAAAWFTLEADTLAAAEALVSGFPMAKLAEIAIREVQSVPLP